MASGGELSGRENCVRWLFVICNILILLFGLALLGIGIWQVVIEDRVEEVLSERYTVGSAIFIAAGVITVLMSLFGIVGAVRKYKYLLLAYLAVFFIIVVLEILVLGYTIAKHDDIDNDLIRSDLQRALDSYYNDTTEGYDEPLNDAVDFIQETLECCGITNYTDWNDTRFFNVTDRYPSSCCGKSEPDTCLGGEIYAKGCEQALEDYIDDNLGILLGIAVAFAVFEILMLVMSFYLFMAINNSTSGYERA